jgi:Molybdopterin-binding domain of aldehyde dehydrogenase
LGRPHDGEPSPDRLTFAGIRIVDSEAHSSAADSRAGREGASLVVAAVITVEHDTTGRATEDNNNLVFEQHPQPKRVDVERPRVSQIRHEQDDTLEALGPHQPSICPRAAGTATVRSDMTDIGTGTYTILSHVAADRLGIPIDQVRLELGSSDSPPSAGSGASWGAANSSNAVHRACEALREQLRANGGRIPEQGLEATGSIGGLFDDPNHQAYSIHSYGAQVAEVGADEAWRKYVAEDIAVIDQRDATLSPSATCDSDRDLHRHHPRRQDRRALV